MQSTSWEMLDWKKHKLESRLPGEISITSDMQMTPPLWQKVKRNSKASSISSSSGVWVCGVWVGGHQLSRLPCLSFPLCFLCPSLSPLLSLSHRSPHWSTCLMMWLPSGHSGCLGANGGHGVWSRMFIWSKWAGGLCLRDLLPPRGKLCPINFIHLQNSFHLIKGLLPQPLSPVYFLSLWI